MIGFKDFQARGAASNYIFLGERLIQEFLENIKEELVSYMQTENRNATGKSAASIKVKDITNNSGKLAGSEYIENVFRGRGPGQMPPISALIDWCNARGLPRSMAWAVAKNIAKAGTQLYQEGRNVLNELITAEKIEKLKNDLLVLFTTNIKTEIRSLTAA